MNLFSKTVVSVSILSIFLIPSVSAESPTIEDMDVWPEEIDHDSDVYVEASVSGSAEDVWFEAFKGSEKVAKAPLYDSNNDGYYTTASSFKVEGGREYRVKVTAYSSSGEHSSREKVVSPECSVGFLDSCIY